VAPSAEGSPCRAQKDPLRSQRACTLRHQGNCLEKCPIASPLLFREGQVVSLPPFRGCPCDFSPPFPQHDLGIIIDFFSSHTSFYSTVCVLVTPLSWLALLRGRAPPRVFLFFWNTVGERKTRPFEGTSSPCDCPAGSIHPLIDLLKIISRPVPPDIPSVGLGRSVTTSPLHRALLFLYFSSDPIAPNRTWCSRHAGAPVSYKQVVLTLLFVSFGVLGS